ncbi:RDD family protein [Akkermansiaceae bacterium]|nr:RDD family protein [Akkermansiaceae bacterium]
MAKVERRLDTLQTVELAEGMEVHLRVAGPFLRFYAFLLDLLIIIASAFVLLFVVTLLASGLGANIAMGIFFLLWFTLAWFYPVFFEVSRKGATPGKMALGLRVVNEAGGTITMGTSMVRNFIRIVEIFIPFLPLAAFLNPRFQRLGDLAAGTFVIYSRPRIDPVFSAPPTLNAIPVNISLTREERAAIISFRHRSGNWSEVRRAELVNHLSTLTGHAGPKGVSTLVGMACWLEDHA